MTEDDIETAGITRHIKGQNPQKIHTNYRKRGAKSMRLKTRNEEINDGGAMQRTKSEMRKKREARKCEEETEEGRKKDATHKKKT